MTTALETEGETGMNPARLPTVRPRVHPAEAALSIIPRRLTWPV